MFLAWCTSVCLLSTFLWISTAKGARCHCGEISPLNSTVWYNEWLTLTITIRCEHTHVRWYTAGNFDPITRLVESVSESEVNCDSDNTLIRKLIRINMTSDVHQTLRGVVAGTSHGERGTNSVPCSAVPPARYYITPMPTAYNGILNINV